jgi:hypothetical protein
VALEIQVLFGGTGLWDPNLPSNNDNTDINKQLRSEHGGDFFKELYKVASFIRSVRVTIQDFTFNKRKHCYIETLLQAM